MLQPKRLKHRKFQRGRMKGTAQRGAFIAFGDYALQAQEPCWMTARQIEAARRAIVHHLKRGGKVWIRVFPDKPVTKKPAEVRMGSGKGQPDHWVAVVRPGRILFELSGVDPALAKEAMRLASYKLPIKTSSVKAWKVRAVQLKDMRRLSDAELADELKNAKEELFNLRFQLATRQLKNYRGVPAARRRIARALSVMGERKVQTNG